MKKYNKSNSNDCKRKSSPFSLVDKCLLIIMAIIFIQTTFNLFECGTNFSDKNTVDVIIRTSAGAIFGYFISANFMSKKSNNDIKIDDDNFILDKGFNLDDKNIDLLRSLQQNQTSHNSYQIIIITIICIASLIILIIGRNFFEFTSQSSAIVSQLKDFISASIGFLVSCGKQHTT